MTRPYTENANDGYLIDIVEQSDNHVFFVPWGYVETRKEAFDTARAMAKRHNTSFRVSHVTRIASVDP